MNQPIEGRPGRYWHILEDHRIQCDVCPRYCKLHEGQRGLCFVPARQGEQMVLTAYGRSSGFCIDPIEKKSFGTAGCNLTCKFCQNWDISKARNFDRIRDLASPEAIALAALRRSCSSVAFTYNDPVIFLEYAVDVAHACRERGIKTVAVSAGYISLEPRIEFFRHMDAANIDLKGFTDGFYKNLYSGKLAPVLETLEYLKHETSVWFEITTLLIPGENDSTAEIEAESVWVMDHLGPDVPLHFTAFHPDWKLMDRPPTPPQTLRMARRSAMNAGLRYVYTGNVHGSAGQATHCHACGAVLIGRDWNDITAWHPSADGRCAKCDTRCHGVYETMAGQWGPSRQPVRLRASTARPQLLRRKIS
jgi:pyruvate formate lyase activating enzyme